MTCCDLCQASKLVSVCWPMLAAVFPALFARGKMIESADKTFENRHPWTWEENLGSVNPIHQPSGILSTSGRLT